MLIDNADGVMDGKSLGTDDRLLGGINGNTLGTDDEYDDGANASNALDVPVSRGEGIDDSEGV